MKFFGSEVGLSSFCFGQVDPVLLCDHLFIDDPDLTLRQDEDRAHCEIHNRVQLQQAIEAGLQYAPELIFFEVAAPIPAGGDFIVQGDLRVLISGVYFIVGGAE